MVVTDGNATKTEVKINNIDVGSYLHAWKNPDVAAGNFQIVNMILSRGVSAVIDLNTKNAAGYSVTIKRGAVIATEEFIFDGEIHKVSIQGGMLNVEARDKLFDLVASEVTKSFDSNTDTEAGKISEIFKTLINDFSNLTADNTSVQDSGTVIILRKFICNHADVYERCEFLAKILDWQFYYDEDDQLVHFEPKGYVDSGQTLTVGTEIRNKPMWKHDSSRMFNQLTVIGGEQLVETEETFDGDGSETTFTLANTPVSVRVEVDDGGGFDLQIGGDPDVTSGTFDYSVDAEKKEIIFESGSIPPTGTDNVKIIYNRSLTLQVTDNDPSSIANFSNGVAIKKSEFKPEIVKKDDALNYIRKQLSIYSTPITSSEQVIVVGKIGLKTGMTATFIDTNDNINDSMVINKIVNQFPYEADRLTIGEIDIVGQTDETKTLDRIRRLEEELGKNLDILIHGFSLPRTRKYERRYAKREKRDLSGAGANIFILGDSNFGILGTSKLGDTSGVSRTLQDMVPGENTYKEYLYDTEFKDAATTATWNTTTKKITFTSGQIALTEPVAKGTTHTAATITLGSVTGTILIEAQFDGTNWETFTNGIRRTITNQGTSGVLIRLTENAATTASVDTTFDSYNQFDQSAIRMVLEQ